MFSINVKRKQKIEQPAHSQFPFLYVTGPLKDL